MSGYAVFTLPNSTHCFSSDCGSDVYRYNSPLAFEQKLRRGAHGALATHCVFQRVHCKRHKVVVFTKPLGI